MHPIKKNNKKSEKNQHYNRLVLLPTVAVIDFRIAAIMCSLWRGKVTTKPVRMLCKQEQSSNIFILPFTEVIANYGFI